MVDVCEIERRRVLRVRLKALDGQSDKRSDRGREQTGLISRVSRSVLQKGFKKKRKTHEDKDPISICFPALSHFQIFILRPVEIHGKETLRPVGEVRLSRRHHLRWVEGVTIVAYS